MGARGGTALVSDDRLAELERVIESPHLHGCESLCRLLRYLAMRTIQEPGAAIREHEIAADVFGRSTFDPRIDSTVRVNVARLRAKLLEYYNGSGVEDPVQMELPKGSYSLVFQTRAPGIDLLPNGHDAAPIPNQPLETRPARRFDRLLLAALVCTTVVTGILAVTLLLENNGRNVRNAAAPPPETSPVRRFWGMLLNSREEPWVVFSNATFVGRPATGMRYMVPSKDSGREVLDFYTGIGEVLGIHALDQTFALLNRKARVKRGGLLSLDDVQNDDVVYVGSPLENLTLRDVPGLHDFEFRLIQDGPRSGQGMLANLAPREGEPKLFLPSALPLTEDFAVVAIVPGLNPSRWALILAGTSTIGTEGAVEFLCREDTVSQLLAKIGTVKPGVLPMFEAVLDIQIKGGVPVHSSIVSFHLHRRPA